MEYDDLAAVIDAAGGSACVYGTSGGAVIALEAAARGLGATRLALWGTAMENRAQALVYDAAILGDFRVPAHRLAKVDVPTLVIDGATSPWMSRSADAVASAVPGSKRRTLEGQPHNVDPAAIAPVLVGFFAA